MEKKDIINRIKTYTKTSYIKLNISDFILGEAPFNKRCHLNSVQKVKEGRAEKVFSCIAIDKDDGSICVHFINQTKDGKYVDHTWGWLYEQTDYYIIREIEESEYSRIWTILADTKKSLINLHTTWFERKLLRIKYDELI
jgi:hypothetical protein